MAPQLVLFAVFCGLSLAALAFSALTWWRANSILRESRRKPACDSAIEVLQTTVEALQEQIGELRRHPPAAAATVPNAPRAALNLEKRSQALRMHRRGAAPAEIASALEIPAQELDLLIKVHRIVLNNI
jgi:hypothetical protein